MDTLRTKCDGDEAMLLLPWREHARGADANQALHTTSSVCKLLLVIASVKRMTGFGDREEGGCMTSSDQMVREGSLRR